MLDDFLVRAVFAGIGVSFASAPLGCFVVWHRMVYFGDATAHAAILGVVLSLALSVSIFAGTLVTALLMALSISIMRQKTFALDTILGVIAHSSLAVGLVAASFVGGIRVDLRGFLFGDILAVSKSDLTIIWIGALCVIALILWRWSPLLISTVSSDLAHTSGVSERREKLILTLALAVTVAVGIKVVGVLMIGALLVIPAASARCFARTPEFMAILAVIIGTIGTLGGIRFSFDFDTPTGPTIVCALAVIFVVSNFVRVISKTA
ncbi:MAG: metal ABC transporter permease [Aestuariivita sp.]|nr:metal ABC transporter permease [Aestuariivita sp.]